MGTLNQSARGTMLVGRSDYVGESKFARAYYDFSQDGGAVGAINLRGDKLPSGAVVIDSYISVVTPVTSGGAATVSLGVESATDIRAAATLATAPALGTAAVPKGAVTRATSAVQLTADRHVVATIATAALTAGKFSVIIEYVELSNFS